jgi:hypothetical protein
MHGQGIIWDGSVMPTLCFSLLQHLKDGQISLAIEQLKSYLAYPNFENGGGNIIG